MKIGKQSHSRRYISMRGFADDNVFDFILIMLIWSVQKHTSDSE